MYELENPHLKYRRDNQRRFSVNIWAGILGTSFLGSVFLPDRLDEEMFLNILKETFVDLFDDITLAAAVHTSWFQMDGARSYNRAAARYWLDTNYPDLTPLDFFLWSFEWVTSTLHLLTIGKNFSILLPCTHYYHTPYIQPPHL